MRTKLGEVYYINKDDNTNEIDVYRCITHSNEKSPEVYFKNIETGIIGHMSDKDVSNSEFTGIIPRYTLKIMYVGECKSEDDNIVHKGYVIAMAPIADPCRAMFEPFYVADLLEPEFVSQFDKGDTVLEAKIYPWETFETLKQLLLNTYIREDIMKSHESNTAKRFPKYKHHNEKSVPVKGYEIIDLILAAIDADLDIKHIYNTKIDPVTNRLYHKNGSKNVRFYKDIEFYITNIITSAYGVKLDITINLDRIKKRDYILVRCGERGEVFVVSYTTGEKIFKVAAKTDDEETQKTLDFLYQSIGRKSS